MRRSWLIVPAVMLFMLPVAVNAADNGIRVVAGGKAQMRIFLPEGAGKVANFAADELRGYILKMTGARMEIALRKGPAAAEKGFQLALRSAAEWQGKESAQSFTIEEKAGRQVVIAGNTEIAILYGVYQYLHELGVRWFTPGDIGENVPRLTDIPADRPLGKSRQSFTPSFAGRQLDLSGWHDTHFDWSDRERYRDEIHHDYDLWLLRNRLHYSRSIHGGHWLDFNTVQPSGGHGLKNYALKGVDFKIEPERYPLVTIDGQAARREKNAQICFTNEKNLKATIENVLAFYKKLEETKNARNTDLDEVSDTCAIGLADCAGICECPECTKVGGEGPYSKDRLVWTFMNRVARAVNERLPGSKIGLFAPYFELQRPPAGMKIEPNIVAVTCRGVSWSTDPADQPFYPFTRAYRENIEATRAAGAELRSYDYVMWQGTPQPLNILDAVQVYNKIGYTHYHAEVMTRNEQVWPILWAMSAYLWDSSQDPQKLLSSFCRDYYGAGGALVEELLRGMDAGSRNIKRIIYGSPANTATMLSDALIVRGRKGLARAVKSAAGKEKERLERFRDTFEMHSLMAESYRAYSRALNERTPGAIAASRRAFAAFEKHWSANKLEETCSPNIRNMMLRMSKSVIEPVSQPKGRQISADRAVWMQELFAGAVVPAAVPNLFPLPEIWKFRVDFEGIGEVEGWQKTDLDDSKGWQPVSTWDCYENQGYNDVDGHFWYRVSFTAPQFPAGKRIYLRIGAVDDEGEIFINGKSVFTQTDTTMWDKSFAFEVTSLIRPGQTNHLAVHGYDGFGAGGIWRPCALYTD